MKTLAALCKRLQRRGVGGVIVPSAVEGPLGDVPALQVARRMESCACLAARIRSILQGSQT